METAWNGMSQYAHQVRPRNATQRNAIKSSLIRLFDALPCVSCSNGQQALVSINGLSEGSWIGALVLGPIDEGRGTPVGSV